MNEILSILGTVLLFALAALGVVTIIRSGGLKVFPKRPRLKWLEYVASGLLFLLGADTIAYGAIERKLLTLVVGIAFLIIADFSFRETSSRTSE